MYLTAYGFVLGLGLLLNLRNWRLFVLTALVGLSGFFPVPRDSPEAFYAVCIAVDVCVGVLAWLTRTTAGTLIADLCVLLVVAHVMGYMMDGSEPLSPYHVIVKILEVSQLAVCVILSPILAPILRNQNATIT